MMITVLNVVAVEDVAERTEHDFFIIALVFFGQNVKKKKP